MHPYRMHIRHKLLPGDFDRRMCFVRWLINCCQRNEEFLRSLVVGDEAAFALNGQVNSWNVQHYSRAREPPEFNFEVNISQQKVTVWLALTGHGEVIGPFFFERNVNGENYLRMTNNEIIPQLRQHYPVQAGGASLVASRLLIVAFPKKMAENLQNKNLKIIRF